jgi:hypothetical protein
MSATEITPLNFSSLDVAPLLAFFGVTMLAIVSVDGEDRIVINNNLIRRARRIMDAYRVNYDLDTVQIIRYRPGVPGELNRILSFRPSEMYPVEGNAYAIKRGGGGIGILAQPGIRSQGQGMAFGRINPNQLSAAQQAQLQQ